MERYVRQMYKDWFKSETQIAGSQSVSGAVKVSQGENMEDD